MGMDENVRLLLNLHSALVAVGCAMRTGAAVPREVREETDVLRAAITKRLHEVGVVTIRPPHTADADCAPFLCASSIFSVPFCLACHVLHDEPCELCGGRGYHQLGCENEG